MSTLNPYESPDRYQGGSALTTNSDGELSIRSFVTEEDVIGFHAHYYFGTAAGRQGRRRRWVVALPLIGLGLYGLLNFRGPELRVVHLIMLISGLTVLFFTSRPVVMWNLRRAVRALLQSGRNVLAFGEQTITLGKEDFIRDTPWSHSSVKWAALERIDLTNEYLYVFYSSNWGVIVPARDFDRAESYLTFAQAAQQRLDAHLTLREATPPPA